MTETWRCVSHAPCQTRCTRPRHWLARDPRNAVDDCDDAANLRWQDTLRARLQELDSRLSATDCGGSGQRLLHYLFEDPHRVANEWFVTYGDRPGA